MDLASWYYKWDCDWRGWIWNGYLRVWQGIEHLNMKNNVIGNTAVLNTFIFCLSILLMNWGPNTKNSGFAVLKRYSPQQIYFLVVPCK